ncbi:MAG: glycosyltransferase [Bacteroidaceae bacterium]|nr:glycosyltransferase [Bacteroidaceae bacterium]
MKVSVIMPVYNAAATLQNSLDSISAQTFRDFEVVFVDDCSTDFSLSLMENFAAGSGIACSIVRQEHNAGVAAARNRGLETATGEYIAWLDADDRMAPDTLQKAVKAAEENKTDIVGWDWTLGFERNGRHMRQADYNTPLDALKALMGGTMRWNLWLFMVRRRLLADNDIHFIDGADMGEDMMLMLRAFASAGRVCRIHESLYSYNAVNTASISHQFSEKRRSEVSLNVTAAERALKMSEYSLELADYFNYLKLYIKIPLLMSANRSDYEIWYSWFPESNRYAATNRALPWRTRAVQWMASKRMWLGVKLYYIFVYKFLYGVVYR